MRQQGGKNDLVRRTGGRREEQVWQYVDVDVDVDVGGGVMIPAKSNSTCTVNQHRSVCAALKSGG